MVHSVWVCGGVISQTLCGCVIVCIWLVSRQMDEAGVEPAEIAVGAAVGDIVDGNVVVIVVDVVVVACDIVSLSLVVAGVVVLCAHRRRRRMSSSASSVRRHASVRVKEAGRRHHRHRHHRTMMLMVHSVMSVPNTSVVDMFDHDDDDSRHVKIEGRVQSLWR